MANYISIEYQYQKGLGRGAKHVGIPMNIYRLNNTTSGDYIQAGNLIGQIYCERGPMKSSSSAFESEKGLKTHWYTLLVDARQLLLGDVLISADTVFNAGYQVTLSTTNEFVGLAIAGLPPTAKDNLAARVHLQVQFYRPSLTPNSVVPGFTVPYSDGTLPERLPVVCTNGQWSVGTLGQTASRVPGGWLPEGASGKIYSAPTDNVTKEEKKSMYCPDLAGFLLHPGDEILTGEGSRYVIVSNYHQESGTVGNQFKVQKLVSGSTP